MFEQAFACLCSSTYGWKINTFTHWSRTKKQSKIFSSWYPRQCKLTIVAKAIKSYTKFKQPHQCSSYSNVASFLVASSSMHSQYTEFICESIVKRLIPHCLSSLKIIYPTGDILQILEQHPCLPNCVFSTMRGKLCC